MNNTTCREAECNAPNLARGLCRAHYNRWYYAGDTVLKDPAESCLHCGGELPDKGARGPRSSYCSKACRRRADTVKHSERRNAEKRAAAAEARAAMKIECRQCGQSFTPSTSRGKTYCSKACARRWQREHESGECSISDCGRPVRAKGLCNKHYKAQLRLEGRLSTKAPWTDERRDAWHRRRAILLEASTGKPVILTEIAERDSWFCGLCKLPVDATLAYPDPMSKSLDHIVPLSKGGAHDPSNAQLAHLRCNVSKGNRAA